MAIKLTKRLSREMITSPINGKHRGRPTIVTIKGGDMLEFRAKGTRQVYEVSLASCYTLALTLKMLSEYHRAKEVYKERKAMGFKRLRKPKAPKPPMSKIIFRAL